MEHHKQITSDGQRYTYQPIRNETAEQYAENIGSKQNPTPVPMYGQTQQHHQGSAFPTMPAMPPASLYQVQSNEHAVAPQSPYAGNVMPAMPLQRIGQQQPSSAQEATMNHLLAFGNTSRNNSSNGSFATRNADANSAELNGKRSPKSISGALSQNEVENVFATEQLKQDYETLRSMTLLDDPTELDTIFMRHTNFTKSNFLYNFLFSRYDRKYRELFERYPGAVYWLTFCLATLVTRSEGMLATICSANSAAGAILRPTRTPLFDTFSMPSTKRSRKDRNLTKKSSATGEEDQTTEKKDETAAEDTNKRKRSDETNVTAKRVSSSYEKPQHPFYATSISLTNRSLFEIGRMTDHCVPPEFAVLFVHARPGICVKINTSADRVPLNGIRGTISRPIVAPLVSRQNRGFTFIHLHFTDSLVQMMCRMADGNAGNNNTINLGTKLNMRVDNLAQSVVSRGENFSDHKGAVTLDSPPFLTAINQFQCTMLTGNLVEIKAYTDTVFRIGHELELKTEERQLFEETFRRTKDELLDELERYQDALEEYEAE